MIRKVFRAFGLVITSGFSFSPKRSFHRSNFVLPSLMSFPCLSRTKDIERSFLEDSSLTVLKSSRLLPFLNWVSQSLHFSAIWLQSASQF